MNPKGGKTVDAFDVSYLIRIQMQSLGWKTPLATNIPFHHVGLQSGHCLNDTIDIRKEEALRNFKRYLQ